MNINQNTVKERVIIFLHNQRISQSFLEKMAGLSNGYLNNVKSISAQKAMSILSAFPELNPNWLLTGDGEMLRKEGVQTIIGDGNHHVTNGSVSGGDCREELNKVLDQNKMLLETVSRSQSQIERLLDIIQSKN